MHNKKSLLQRLLVIYIAFFSILTISVVHNVFGEYGDAFMSGWNKATLDEQTEQSGGKVAYKESLYSIKLDHNAPIAIENGDIKGADLDIKMTASHINITLTDHTSTWDNLKSSDLITILLALLYMCFLITIITLMFKIINSIRRSIREEEVLSPKNIWYMRNIGILTIIVTLMDNLIEYGFQLQAARILITTNIPIDTGFNISYSPIIMGIIIIFTAEVFAIGHNLSEEQKLTV